jgi:hypothetical protein
VFEIAAICFSQFGIEGDGDGNTRRHITIESLVYHDLGDTIVVLMIFIKRKFIPYPQSDQHGNGHTDGQSCDIDKGMHFAFAQIAESDH